MKPIPFPEANRVYQKPQGWTDEECQPLPVFTDGKQCVSLWEPTPEERHAIATGAPVYLLVVLGDIQPPVLLTTDSPFIPLKSAAPLDPNTPACAKCVRFQNEGLPDGTGFCGRWGKSTLAHYVCHEFQAWPQPAGSIATAPMVKCAACGTEYNSLADCPNCVSPVAVTPPPAVAPTTATDADHCEVCGQPGIWLPLGQFDSVCPDCGGNSPAEAAAEAAIDAAPHARCGYQVHGRRCYLRSGHTGEHDLPPERTPVDPREMPPQPGRRYG